MKIKEICEKTGLTDRTVRYYIEEQLISPFYTENYLGRRSFDFSDEDLEKLKNISTLRAFGFSIEELKALSDKNADHGQIVDAVKSRAEESLGESKRRLSKLSCLDPSEKTSISELAQKLSAPDVELQNESAIPHNKKSFSSFLSSCAIFLAVWLPIILPISVLVFKIALTQLPIVRPIFLIFILLCFLPSMVTVIIPKRKNGAKRYFRTIFILLCVLCIPLGMFLSSKCVTSCGHSYDTYRVIVDATCQREGEIIVKCDDCGGYGTKKVEKLPHNGIVISGVKPTCSAAGVSDGYKCTLCNEILIDQKRLSPTEMHTPVVDAAVAPTCTKAGLSEGSHCSVCEKVLVAQTTVEIIEHTPAKLTAVAPTCKDTGLTEGSFCSVCDQVLVEQEIIPMTDEHIAVIDAAIAPTCKSTGWTEGSHCEICDEILTARVAIPATGHSYTYKKVEPTCGAIGYTLYECSCGSSYKTDNMRETNKHDFQISDAGYTCKACGLVAMAQGSAGGIENTGSDSIKYFITQSDVISTQVILVIYGSGDMPDYSSDNPIPWNDYVGKIRTIIIESEITSIGMYAFFDSMYHNTREFIIRSKHVKFGSIDPAYFNGISILCEIIYDY